MTTKKTFKSRTKLILVIPLTLLALSLFTLNVQAQKPAAIQDKGAQTGMKEVAYQQVDVMPTFPGGDRALLKFIADSVHYPKDAKAQSIQGKVVARFVVMEDGSVSNVSILQSVSPTIDAESIRVVKMLPKFTPGILKGKAVPVWYMVPITFKLK
jgi:TonB family protein